MGKPSRRSLAEEADRVARILEQDAFHEMKLTLRSPVSYANLILDLDDRLVTQEVFTDEVRSSLSDVEWAFLQAMADELRTTPGEDLIQLARWARTRVVYTVDPDTAAAVLDTDWGDTVIPGDVLARLPHPNPLVVLPEPVEWVSNDGRIERYEAFAVLGVRPPRRRTSSDDPQATNLVLHFFGHMVEPGTGKYWEGDLVGLFGSTMHTRSIIGFRAVTPIADATMGERVRAAIADMEMAGPAAKTGFLDDDDAATGMERVTRIGLALLVYLVSDDVDVRRTRMPAARGKGKGSVAASAVNAAPNQVVEVGFRVGAALRASRSETRASGGEGKRTVAPHIRRAHIHTFRRGPRSSPEKFVKWLPPLAVGVQSERHGKTQVHVK